MRNVYYLHSLNETIAFCIGVVLNSFLVWLMFKTKIPKLSKYSNLLLQPVLVNVFLLLANYAAKPMKIIDHGYEFYIMNGVAHYLPQPWNFIVYDVWVFAIGLSITTIPIGFLYQYYMVVHNVQISWKKQLMYFAVSGLIAFGYSILCYFVFYHDSYMHLAKGNFLQEFIGDENGVVWTVGLSVPYIHNRIVLINIVVICVVVTLSYSIVVYCNCMTYLHIRRHKKLSNDVQRQLSHIIIYMAIVPLISTAFPCTIIIWTLLHPEIPFIPLTVYITFPFAWVAPCNAFFFLFLIKPYREQIINFVAFLIPKKTYNQPVNTINTCSIFTNTVTDKQYKPIIKQLA